MWPSWTGRSWSGSWCLSHARRFEARPAAGIADAPSGCPNQAPQRTTHQQPRGCRATLGGSTEKDGELRLQRDQRRPAEAVNATTELQWLGHQRVERHRQDCNDRRALFGDAPRSTRSPATVSPGPSRAFPSSAPSSPSTWSATVLVAHGVHGTRRRQRHRPARGGIDPTSCRRADGLALDMRRA